jgi:hypothetical protein
MVKFDKLNDSPKICFAAAGKATIRSHCSGRSLGSGCMATPSTLMARRVPDHATPHGAQRSPDALPGVLKNPTGWTGSGKPDGLSERDSFQPCHVPWSWDTGLSAGRKVSYN